MSIEIKSVTKTIALDFAQKTSPVTVFAKQGDENTRFVTIQPLMNGVPVSIDRDAHYEARFAAKKPDGKFVYNDSATITDDGLISVVLSDQTLAAHGNAICCVILVNEDTQETLSSQNFTLIIEYSAGAYKNLASSDEIIGLDAKLAQVQELIDKLNGEIGIGIHEVSSPDEITADSPDGLYVVPKQSGESGGNTGGTDTTALERRVTNLEQTADDLNVELQGLEERVMDLESGGGYAVVELTTDLSKLINVDSVELSAEDATALENAARNRIAYLVFPIDEIPIAIVAFVQNMEGVYLFSMFVPVVERQLVLTNGDGPWIAMLL